MCACGSNDASGKYMIAKDEENDAGESISVCVHEREKELFWKQVNASVKGEEEKDIERYVNDPGCRSGLLEYKVDAGTNETSMKGGGRWEDSRS